MGNKRGQTGAQKLARAWARGQDIVFHDLADGFIAGGDQESLEAAVCIVSAQSGQAAAREIADQVMTIAEMGYLPARDGGILSVDLFAVPVLCPQGPAMPLPEQFRMGLEFSGMFDFESRLVVARKWCSVESFLELSPTAARRVLLSLVDGAMTTDLVWNANPSHEHGALLVGVSIRPCSADEHAEEDRSVLQDTDEEMDELVEEWRASVCGSSSPLALDVVCPAPPSSLGLAIREHHHDLEIQAAEHGQNAGSLDLEVEQEDELEVEAASSQPVEAADLQARIAYAFSTTPSRTLH